MKNVLLPFITVGWVVLAPTSFAALEDFRVSLDAAQDGGAGRQGSGFGTVTLDTVANTITLNNITYSGLSANSTLAHFHGPAAAGANASVLYDLAGFTTLGGTSGTFSGTFSLTAGTGGFSIAQQVSQLEGGLWYLNVHSATFGGGEIRGQVLPIPEPSTLGFLRLGVCALAWRLCKRN